MSVLWKKEQPHGFFFYRSDYSPQRGCLKSVFNVFHAKFSKDFRKERKD